MRLVAFLFPSFSSKTPLLPLSLRLASPAVRRRSDGAAVNADDEHAYHMCCAQAFLQNLSNFLVTKATSALTLQVRPSAPASPCFCPHLLPSLRPRAFSPPGH